MPDISRRKLFGFLAAVPVVIPMAVKAALAETASVKVAGLLVGDIERFAMPVSYIAASLHAGRAYERMVNIYPGSVPIQVGHDKASEQAS